MNPILKELNTKIMVRFASCILAGAALFAVASAARGADPGSLPGETPEAYQARMQWWREARFGMFIHWGPVSLTGENISWSRGGVRRDGQGTGTIPPEIYDNLYRQFNPTNFNARKWVGIAKSAGMKYMVFVTKHHDGFNLFDTKLSDYKITSTNSPFGRDVAKELADACHEANLPLIWYFSLADWHHTDYYTTNHDRFTDYLLGEIRELCTNYGKVSGFWFDGAYSKLSDNGSQVSRQIRDIIHQLQPGAIIDNRCRMQGDYDTPEGSVGPFQMNRPWETCMTLGHEWAWKPKDDVKSFQDCVEIIVNTAGADGNLLLNVGPMPDGQIESRQVEVLQQVGDWLTKYGQTIYGTRGGPFMPGDYGTSTHKDNRIYLHVTRWDGDSISLPPLPRRIVNCSLLTGGQVEVKQGRDETLVTVAKRHQSSPDTIVVLELEGLADELAPIRTALGSVAFQKKATASSSDDGHAPDRAFDGDDKTGWIAAPGTTQNWLEVDLGDLRKLAQAVIYETNPGRICEFELQCKGDGEWQSVYRGRGLGAQAVIRFQPVAARRVRLNILNASGAPGIKELKLTGPLDPAAKEYKVQGDPVSDEVWAAYLERWVKVGALDVAKNSRVDAPDKLLEGGRWVASKPAKDGTLWLDLDFGRERTFNQAVATTSRHWQYVKCLELQQWSGGQWKTFYANPDWKQFTGDATLKFDPVTLRQFRMKVTMTGSNHTFVIGKLDLSDTRNTLN